MVELVDTRGLGPRVARRAGSSPVPGTTHVETLHATFLRVCFLFNHLTVNNFYITMPMISSL